MDNNFTLKLQQWVNTPDEQKDWDEGAILLLQLSGNKIMYHNIAVNPKGKAEFIKGKLQKYLDFRLQQLTHEQVAQMQQQVDEIVARHPVIAKPLTATSTAVSKTEGEEFKAGKRADHDLLPDEIKALYVENLDIVNRMRELHLRLRLLSTEDVTCPDSERYPFLKRLIELDKQLHENWNTYDHYVISSASSSVVSDSIAEGKATSAITGSPVPSEAVPVGSDTIAADGEPAEETTPAAETEAKPTVTAKKTAKRTSRKTA